ncbi:MAG: hypothetical protein EPO43_05315 [Rugosibacter sp.]|nr:MAG: hypothetical protein EPO43_05315 [Rugosibacter sp.]
MTNVNTGLPILPPGFESLTVFVDKWAVEPLSKRQQARMVSSMDDIRAFYDAILPKSEAAIVYLNQFKLDKMPREARILMNLMLSLMEVAHSVELWHRVDQRDAFPLERLELILDK